MTNIQEQIKELINSYPKLKITNETEDKYVVAGNVFINAKYNNIQLADSFDIELNVFKDFPKRIPDIIEKSKKIPSNFQHVNPDRKLCLAVNIDMLINLKENKNLLIWFNKYVVSFFFSCIFFNRYGKFPYGERSHGDEGVVEFYQEFFNTKDIKAIFRLLQVIVGKEKQFKDNLCPCGSYIKYRRCHLKQVEKLQNIEEIKKDLYIIRKRIYVGKKTFFLFPYSDNPIAEILKYEESHFALMYQLHWLKL